MRRWLMAVLWLALGGCATAPIGDAGVPTGDIAAASAQSRGAALVQPDVLMARPVTVPDVVKPDAATPVLFRLLAQPTSQAVVRVDFYRGDLSLVGTARSAPYVLPVQAVAAGPRTIYAIGRDAAGAPVEFWVTAFTVTVAAQPPPPPPPGAALAHYRFTSAGWATFGLALPPGAATGAVQVGALPTQTDVKTTWPDGSIRFAVVTAKVLMPQAYDIAAGVPAAGAPLAPAWPAVSLALSVPGPPLLPPFMARLPAFDGSQGWLSGPLVREARVLVTPVSAGVAHPLLQVLFDVRSYADGTHRIDVCVQNVRDVAIGAAVAYDASLTVDGAQAYARPGLVQPYLTRWRKVAATAGFAEAAAVPDFEPFYLARAIPRYLPTVADPVPALGAGFVPLGFGDMSADMSSPGGRPEIAPYPNWTAQYLAHERPEQRAYMLAAADVSGSWRGHITDPDGQTLVSLDAWPSYWLDGRAGTRTAPLNGLTGPDAARQLHNGGPFPGGWSESIETAHMPSLSFVPYLVTGDRWHLDQMKFWSNFTLLAGVSGRGGAAGLLADNQVRGIAWAMRSLGDLAAYIPDADPMAGYFRQRLRNNLAWLDAFAAAPGGPFEWSFLQSATGDRIAPWMNNYVAWALERAAQHGFAPATALRDRLVRQQLRFFASDPEWPRAVETYYPTVAARDAAGRLAFLQTMRQVYDASMAVDDTHRISFAGQYGVDARLVLLLGVRDGLPGAQAALDFLMAQPNMPADVAARSGWAVR